MARSRFVRAKPVPKAPSPASQNGNGEEDTPTATATATDAGRQRKPKLSRGSCTPCRAAKLKCNKKKPSCDTCLEAGTECSYPLEMKRKDAVAAKLSEEPEVSRADPKKTARPKKPARRSGSPKGSVEVEEPMQSDVSEHEEEPRVSTKTQARPKDDSSPTVRRSGRGRKLPPLTLPDGVDDDDELALSPTFPKSGKAATNKTGTRRNLKRKVAPETFEIPDELLDATLAPMGGDELDEWEAWVELESDPAFFTVILQDLGVKDVKIQELFSVDEGSLAILPKPVHGLIFLYQYVEEDAGEEAEGGDNVWFANQTTDNACATLALFNIIMNARDIELGDRLNGFKQESADLIPPLKGNRLCGTTWIRSIHNQFARRLDLLNADLTLSNEAGEFAQKREKEKKTSRLQVAKRQRKTKKPTTDAAYHFIAYVPVDGEVYQLDGLEKAPVSIGKVDANSDWTSVARPFIESRMLQYESEQLSFNLLALCRSPLHQLRSDLVTNMRTHSAATAELARRQQTSDEAEDGPPRETPHGFITLNDDESLSQCGISPEVGSCESDQDRLQPQSTAELRNRCEELETEQARLRAEYNTEQMMVADDVRRAKGRKKDYTPVIHQWVQLLADKGLLAEIASEVEHE